MDDPALEEIRARRLAQLMAGKGGGGGPGGAMTPEAQQQQVGGWVGRFFHRCSVWRGARTRPPPPSAPRSAVSHTLSLSLSYTHTQAEARAAAEEQRAAMLGAVLEPEARDRREFSFTCVKARPPVSHG